MGFGLGLEGGDELGGQDLLGGQLLYEAHRVREEHLPRGRGRGYMLARGRGEHPVRST